MKKYILMAAALMMMGLGMSSCSKENEEQTPKTIHLTLTASFDDVSGNTKAAWETSVKPKFEVGDKVGVYSHMQTVAQDPYYLTVTAVNASGIATLEGQVIEADEYHLVFPYKEESYYLEPTGEIRGFDDFAAEKNSDLTSLGTYPKTALHYALLNGSETCVTFQNLCAILKVAAPTINYHDDDFVIEAINRKSPVIHTKGSDGPYVEAQADDEPEDCFLNGDEYVYYYPAAPGTVTIESTVGKGTKTVSVAANKIYWVHAE